MRKNNRHQEPTPERHAMWAAIALRGYIHNRDSHMDEYHTNPRAALTDLLVDLMHMARLEGLGFGTSLLTALDQFEVERQR